MMVGLSIALGQVLASMAVRWVVLPRLEDGRQLLAGMVVGMALAEGAQFSQIFLIGPGHPEIQRAVLVLAMLAGVQFFPWFLPRSTNPR